MVSEAAKNKKRKEKVKKSKEGKTEQNHEIPTNTNFNSGRLLIFVVWHISHTLLTHTAEGGDTDPRSVAFLLSQPVDLFVSTINFII